MQIVSLARDRSHDVEQAYSLEHALLQDSRHASFRGDGQSLRAWNKFAPAIVVVVVRCYLAVY